MHPIEVDAAAASCGAELVEREEVDLVGRLERAVRDQSSTDLERVEPHLVDGQHAGRLRPLANAAPDLAALEPQIEFRERVPHTVVFELRQCRPPSRVGIALGATRFHGVDGTTQHVGSDLPRRCRDLPLVHAAESVLFEHPLERRFELVTLEPGE